MPDARSAAVEAVQRNYEKNLETLQSFLKLPTISTDPSHKADIQRTAEWLTNQLGNLGFKTQIIQTKLHPVVYGENLSAGPSAPTLLIYGHYDVQPVEPLELWQSEPFQPEIRGENLYARGASDMKGQVMATMNAVEAVLAQGKPPVNFKFILEGEEEIGSPSLEEVLKEYRDLLACDLVLNPDSGMIAPDLPTITYALRGLAYFELRVYGPEHDLHSGMFGGVVHNPAQALCEIIAGMHDENGTVTLPDFYDGVLAVSEEERKQLARLPVDEQFYLEKTGAPTLWGEKQFTPMERATARPTLEIHGLLSGFTGSGTKTVIPSWAMAKISSRLVPGQDPEAVHQSLRRYLEQKVPASIRWELTFFGGGPAVIANLDLPGVKALAKALEIVWHASPVYKREGGSIPVVVDMQNIMGKQSVITGFGLPDDNVHAPNEKLHLPTWRRGREALVHFIYNLAE